MYFSRTSNKMYSADIIARFDRPTVHASHFDHVSCNTHKPKKNEFVKLLQNRGVDVDKHSLLVRVAYADMADGSSEHIQGALSRIQNNIRQKERVVSPTRKRMEYERRENGYEGEVVPGVMPMLG